MRKFTPLPKGVPGLGHVIPLLFETAHEFPWTAVSISYSAFVHVSINRDFVHHLPHYPESHLKTGPSLPDSHNHPFFWVLIMLNVMIDHSQ